MELTFIVNAIRRYLWVVVACTILGVVPGLLLGGEDAPSYESRSVLLLQPPTDATGPTMEANRYVAGQISVLSSEVLAERVVERLDDGTPRAAVANAVRIESEPNTDIVHVVISTSDPERSQVIGTAYLAEYFEALRAQVENTQQPEVEKVQEQIAELRERLAANSSAAEAALAPYRGPGQTAFPDLEQIAPDLAVERDLLVAEIQEANTLLSALNTNARLRVSTEIVQEATLPSAPVPAAPNLLLAVGLVGGFGLGLFLAVVLARLSPMVLDDDQAEEILGYPMVGKLPAFPRASSQRTAMLGEMPRSVASFVGGLCVRSEAVTKERPNLAVVVIGPRRGSGATTLASALSRRFAEGGARVLLVDADRHHSELRALYNAEQSGLPVSLGSPVGDGEEHADEVLGFVPTELDNLFVSNLQTLTGAPTFRPNQVRAVVDRTIAVADVVVFDGGPLLEAASTVHLARACDVVILAVPEMQDSRELEVVAGEVRGRYVLPVWTPARPDGGLLRKIPVIGPRLARRRG